MCEIKFLFHYVRHLLFRNQKFDVVIYLEDISQQIMFSELIDILVDDKNINLCVLYSFDPNQFTLCHVSASYYIGKNFFRSLAFLFLRAKLCILSTPDIQNLHLKKSIVSNVYYLYAFHSPVSTHMIYREGAFVHYDGILCVGPHHIDEFLREEQIYKGIKREYFKAGYLNIDRIIKQQPKTHSFDMDSVLLAPSWGEAGLLANGAELIISNLMAAGYRVILRPHPIDIQRKTPTLMRIISKYEGYESFILDSDPDQISSFSSTQLLISDWSGVAYEYYLSECGAVIFIDTERKVLNKNYEVYEIDPIEVSYRGIIGTVVSINQLDHLASIVENCKPPSGVSAQKERLLYNINTSARESYGYIRNILSRT